MDAGQGRNVTLFANDVVRQKMSDSAIWITANVALIDNLFSYER